MTAITESHVEVLTFEETRAMLRCSRTTLFRLVNEGQLPSFKIGRTRRFLAEDVDSFARGLSAASPSD